MLAEGGTSPLFCASFEREIGGVKYQQCVQTNASTGATIRRNNEKTCFNDDGGTAGSWDMTDTQANPITPCTGPGDCATAGVGVVCDTSSSSGACNNAAGTCS